MTKSTPQLCKDGFDIQDGSSRVVLLMTKLLVMKFSGQIQLGEEIMCNMFTVVFSVQYCEVFPIILYCYRSLSHRSVNPYAGLDGFSSI